MVAKKDLVALRSYQPQDENFIFTTWLRGLRYGNDWFSRIDQASYFKNYHAVVEKILHKSTTRVNVACLKEEPDVLLGYSVYEPINDKGNILHWIYVKPLWREIGIAKDLMPSGVKKVTHLTWIGKRLAKKAGIEIVDRETSSGFDPFAI